MTKKDKITVIVSVISGFFITLACFIGGILIASYTPKSVRQKIYNYYADDKNYLTLYGDVFFCVQDYNALLRVTVNLSEECVQTLNREGKKKYEANKNYSYYFNAANRDVLTENGFNEVLNEVINDYSVKYYRVDKPVTLIVSEGFRIKTDPTVVSVTAGDTCYLDFETGKANLLYYVQHVMK
ncbi:MAG: hypothetical protein K2N22_01490 [Clostridia bacterium]|nr:hypothetical protein [Clostridia bacterium]